MTNRLSGETSPYLLQHANNPVDWYPWGPEAIERARHENLPIFLSVGYAACHWCHVMERESFENASIAKLINEHFVPIKVDREERPDLDEIYMSAIQLMTGQGGWPLNVFLTPDLRPFFGGTYFPPEDRWGRIGLPMVLERVRDAWASKRDEIDRSAEEMTAELRRIAGGPGAAEGSSIVGATERKNACDELATRFDAAWGGFGGAPKFPSDGALTLLLDESTRSGECMLLEMAETTLERMALGGLYDHVGGGFCRYSVDERWLVPHFEKMLYNQALLVPIYLDAWLLSGKPLYRRVAEQTLDFVRRELTDERGGLHSSLDADSEGEEGRFYVWNPAQLESVLGKDDAAFFGETYDITEQGNWEGRSIPNLIAASLEQRAAKAAEDEEALAQRLDPMRRKLLEARELRERPATDDKVLTAWNGLAIGAFARAYQTLGRSVDLESARRAADFALDVLWTGSRLHVTYRNGRAKLNGYLDDYAFLGRGLLELYEACFDPRYLSAASSLAAKLVEHFEDREHGGFFFVSDDHETLITRTHSLHDGALPSGAGVACELLLRLAVHGDDAALRGPAERTLSAYSAAVERMPSAYATLLMAAGRLTRPPVEIAVVGALEDPATHRLLAVVRGSYRMRPAVQAGPPCGGDDPRAILRGHGLIDGAPAAYVCRDYACRSPTSDPTELGRLLEES